MEKPPERSKRRRLLRLVHKAASFSVPNTPYTPARAQAHRAFSGPIVPMIPAEARGRDVGGGGGGGLEPTSPRVTCVGRVAFGRQDAGGGKRGKERRAWFFAVLGWLFQRRARRGRGGGDAGEDGVGTPPPVTEFGSTPPPLGQMRRLGRGRERLQGFERRAAPVAAEVMGEERAEEPVEGEEEEGEEQVAVAVAGWTAAGAVAADGDDVGLERRKEVKVWKRRAVAPLGSLQV